MKDKNLNIGSATLVAVVFIFGAVAISSPSSPAKISEPDGTEVQVATSSNAIPVATTALTGANVASTSATSAQPASGQSSGHTTANKGVPAVSDMPAPVPVVATSTAYMYYPVTKVVDGDTIKIDMSGISETIRILGINTPESVDPTTSVQCYGPEASAEGKTLLSGRTVRIEIDPTQGERDKYGRLLAYVWRDDGLFYDEYMVSNGYAYEYTYNKPYEYQTEFRTEQAKAKAAELGLWSPSTCNGSLTATISASSTQPASVPTSDSFYTSSYHTAKYYYPAACSGWESLSTKYLESFPTLDALIVKYPNRRT